MGTMKQHSRALFAGILAGALLLACVSSAVGAFSGDGFETTGFGGVDVARGVAIQPDHKIVAAGSTTSGADFALARFKRGGNVDGSFSGDGRKTTDFGGSDEAFDVAVESGRIVVVGRTDAKGEDHFALARYRKSGALDDSFSGNGKQITGSSENAVAQAVAIQRNGRIVVVGWEGRDFALARYKQNGHLDHSFSGDGKQTTNFAGERGRPGKDRAFGVAIQPNGRIVVVGGSFPERHREDFAIARYRRNGHLDHSFAGDGRRIVPFGSIAVASDVAIQRDGKIVAAGSSTSSNGSSAFAITRLTRHGELDRSFNRNVSRVGREITFVGNSRAFGEALAINRNRILVVGHTGPRRPEPSSTREFAFVRYRENGDLDDSFSGDGKKTTSFGPGDDLAHDVAFQSRKKFVVTGVTGPEKDFIVARYRNRGGLDD
jgi:uncharacterized delta-60 repeat protein